MDAAAWQYRELPNKNRVGECPKCHLHSVIAKVQNGHIVGWMPLAGGTCTGDEIARAMGGPSGSSAKSSGDDPTCQTERPVAAAASLPSNGRAVPAETVGPTPTPPTAAPPKPDYEYVQWRERVHDIAVALVKKDPAFQKAFPIENLAVGLTNDLLQLQYLPDDPIKLPASLNQAEAEEELQAIAAQALRQRNGTELPALPDLFGAGVKILSGQEALRRYKGLPRNRTLIDGLLALKEVSLWSGKVEHGKTTLLRTMVMCVLRGEPFLGRTCIKGRVLYVMLDADGEELTIEEFLKLGWDPERDNLDFLFDPVFALRPNSFNDFYARVLEGKPDLIVIDPFGRFQQIVDFNDYGTTYAVARLSEFAKQVNAHIALPHHIPRGRSDDAEAGTAGLGSISIGGGVNARFVCTKKPGDVFTVKTSKGKGSGFVPFEAEMVLSRDPISGWISVAGEYSYKDQARALKQQVLQVIERSEEPMTASQIAKELGLFKSACGLAANMLYNDDHAINREGTGKRNSKYLYSRLENESGLWKSG